MNEFVEFVNLTLNIDLGRRFVSTAVVTNRFISKGTGIMYVTPVRIIYSIGGPKHRLLPSDNCGTTQII